MSYPIGKRVLWSLQHSSYVSLVETYRQLVDNRQLFTRICGGESRSSFVFFDTANDRLESTRSLWTTNREPCSEATWGQEYVCNGTTTSTLGGNKGRICILDECMLMFCRAAHS